MMWTNLNMEINFSISINDIFLEQFDFAPVYYLIALMLLFLDVLLLWVFVCEIWETSLYKIKLKGFISSFWKNLFGGDVFFLLKKTLHSTFSGLKTRDQLTILSNSNIQTCVGTPPQMSIWTLTIVKGRNPIYINLFYRWNQTRGVFKYAGFKHSYMMHSHMQSQVWSQVGCLNGAEGIHQHMIVGFCGKARWSRGQGLSWVS